MAQDKKARYRDISDGLLRQRRNLMVISLAMPLFFVSGAKVEKVNLLGTVVELSNPKVVEYLLVSLFVYFLLRYWQYYKEESYISDMKTRIRHYTTRLEISYLKKRVQDITSFIEPTQFLTYFANPRYSNNVSGGLRVVSDASDRVTFLFMRQCKFYVYAKVSTNVIEAQGMLDKFDAHFQGDNLVGWERVDNPNPRGSKYGTYYGNVINYSIFRFNFYRLIGYVKYMLNESYFTDYQLPFVVALASIISSLTAIAV